MTKKLSWKLSLVLLLFPVAALAQVPLPTGSGPAISASLGYSYVSLPIPSSTRIGLNGANASIGVDFRSRFGAKIEVNYARAANVFATGRHADVLTYMLGPLFYPVRNDRWSVYIEALAGGGRVTGVVPNGANGFDTAYTDGLAWAIGGGIERRISPALGIRTEFDYLHTNFTDSSAVFRSQNDLRFAGSLIYRWAWHWGGRAERRHS
jgi:hypothetical protein